MNTMEMKKTASGPRRVSSPAEMHDYMRVTSPGLWLILGTLIVLLIALVVFSSFFTLENTLKVKARVEVFENTIVAVTCTLPLSDKDVVALGQKVRIAGTEGTIDFIMQDEEELNVTVAMDDESFTLPPGLYDAEIVLEATTPIHFLIN